MRWIVRIAVALVLSGILLVGAVSLIPAQRVADLAAARFESATGRALRIEGAARPTLWPRIGVRTGAVTLADADWADREDDGPMLEAEALDITLDLKAMLRGAVRLRSITVLRPILRLERLADGRANWDTGPQVPPGPTDGIAQATSVTAPPVAVVITDGRLRVRDAVTGTDVALDAVTLDLSIAEGGGPVALDLVAARAGQVFTLAGTLGEAAMLTEGRVGPADLRFGAGRATATFAGRLGLAPLLADGRIEADLADLTEVAALAGQPDPDLPQGLGSERVALQGTLTVDDTGALYLRDAALTLDGNRVTGDADLVPGGDRFRLSAQLSATDLVLGGPAAGPQSGLPKAATLDGWPAAPLDVSALGRIDARIGFTAQSVSIGTAEAARPLRFGPSQVLMTLDRRRAVFDIARVAVHEGALSGQFVVNGRGGLSVGGTLTLADVALAPALAGSGGEDGAADRLSGRGTVKATFLGVGDSVDAIMKSLEGAGTLVLTGGAWRGLDLAAVLASLDPASVGAGGVTVFDSLTASVAIAGGVLSNTDLVLSAPRISATGAGAVGLGARTLDYRLLLEARIGAADSDRMRVPLVINGPWAAPVVRLDLEGMARTRLEAEARALAERARAAAGALEAETRARLADRLEEEDPGIAPAPGEDPQDAVRRRAAEVIDREAARLLQDLIGGGASVTEPPPPSP